MSNQVELFDWSIGGYMNIYIGNSGVKFGKLS